MKIAIFTDTFPPEINGVATSSYSLKNVLEKNGHTVLVVSTNPLGNNLLFGDDIIRIPGRVMKQLYDYRYAKIYNNKVMKALKRFSPDVIHVQTDGGVGIFGRICSSLLKVPGVYTYHTMYEDYTYYFTRFFNGHLERMARTIVRWYVNIIVNMANEFITPSEKIKNYLRNIGIDSYINVVPTGIDFDRFSFENQNVNKIKAFKEAHGVKESTFTLLSLGRIASEKSIDVCLKAVCAFKNEYPDFDLKFFIVGSGPAEDSLKELATSLKMNDYVQFLGNASRDEVPFYYHISDAFISASITETQGLTFMEAMASHKIVIARYDDNLFDVISDNQTGFFFHDEKDFPRIFDHIVRLSEDQKTRIVNEAFKKIDSYSIDKFYSNIMEVYERALRQNW